MADTEYPSMSGWKKREMQARDRARRKEQMAAVREARARNREREEALIRGEEVEPPPVTPQGGEADSPTVTSSYPDAESMDREEMLAYLSAHGVRAHPHSKDETLRKKVQEVRDGR